MKNKIITLAISFLASSGMAMADLHEVENFTAYISAKDLKNSSGQALTSGGSALRQDRANYFKFNKKDSMDDAGTAKFFKSASNRALIPNSIALLLFLSLVRKITTLHLPIQHTVYS